MPSQTGYFDTLKSVAGKVFTYLASITLTGTDGKIIACTQNTDLDEAAAMSSKAPKDNPTFTTALTTPSIKAAGAEQLKTWTYTHTITAAEIIAGVVNIAITAVTIVKIRSFVVTYSNTAVIWPERYAVGINMMTSVRISTTTNVEIGLAASALADHLIFITIIEAV